MAFDGDIEFSPNEIRHTEFPTAFRGYDQEAVRQYLQHVASFVEGKSGSSPGLFDKPSPTREQFEEVTQESQQLQATVARLEQQLAARAGTGSSGADKTSGELQEIELLGNETARVLEAARSGAKDIVRRAQNQATLLKEKSESEAAGLQERMTRLLAEKQAEADSSAAKITSDSQKEAERLVSEAEDVRRQADSQAKRLIAGAQDQAGYERSNAEAEAAETVSEARRLREDILGDLVNRRREGRQELDQIFSSRERLHQTLRTARNDLDSLISGLDTPIDLTDHSSSAGDYKDTQGSTIEETGVLARALDRKRPQSVEKVRSGRPVSRPDEGSSKELPASEEDDTDIVELRLDNMPSMAMRRTEDEPSFEYEDNGSEQDPELAESQNADGIEIEESNDTDPVVVDATGKFGNSEEPVNGETSQSAKHSDSEFSEQFDIDPASSLFESTSENVLDELLDKEIPLDRTGSSGHSKVVRRGDVPFEEFEGEVPAPFIARDVAITRFGPSLRRRLKRTLNDDQSDVLNRLRGGGARRKDFKVTPEDLPDLAEQLQSYVDLLEEGLLDIASAGVVAVGGEAVPTEAVHNLALQVAKHIVQSLRVPTVNLIEQAEKEEREALHDPIRSLYRSFRSDALECLTEDAINEAFSMGMYFTFTEEAGLRWLLDPRCDPAPMCEINAATLDVQKGDCFPSGHPRPLSLPGCRCLVVVADSK